MRFSEGIRKTALRAGQIAHRTECTRICVHEQGHIDLLPKKFRDFSAVPKLEYLLRLPCEQAFFLVPLQFGKTLIIAHPVFFQYRIPPASKRLETTR